MEITYTNIFKDLFYFQLWEINRSPVRNISNGIVMILFVSIASLVGDSRDLSDRIIAGITVLILMVIVLFIFETIAAFFFCKSKKNKTFFTEHTVKFVEDGIFSEDKYGKSQLNWTIVQSIKRSKKYIYVYFAQSKAFVIPNHAFVDDMKRNEFYDHINTLWKKHSENQVIS